MGFFGKLLHVLAMLSLMIVGGNYVHALEPDQNHHHVTDQSAVDEITPHQHLESQKSGSGHSAADVLHCGADILVLAPECTYLTRVTGSEHLVETPRIDHFLLPTQEPPPPRILI